MTGILIFIVIALLALLAAIVGFIALYYLPDSKVPAKTVAKIETASFAGFKMFMVLLLVCGIMILIFIFRI